MNDDTTQTTDVRSTTVGAATTNDSGGAIRKALPLPHQIRPARLQAAAPVFTQLYCLLTTNAQRRGLLGS